MRIFGSVEIDDLDNYDILIIPESIIDSCSSVVYVDLKDYAVSTSYWCLDDLLKDWTPYNGEFEVEVVEGGFDSEGNFVEIEDDYNFVEAEDDSDTFTPSKSYIKSVIYNKGKLEKTKYEEY